MIQQVVLGISLLVFIASFVSSPRFRNAQSYKLLGFFGDFASHGLIIILEFLFLFQPPPVLHKFK